MELLENINAFINGIVWGPFMLLFLLGTGIFFTIRLRFFQFRHFRLLWNLTIGSLGNNHSHQKNGISSFQAMTTALAGAIGTGNIVGVAGAIALGGAGAVFWMWIAAFFGMATIYAENVLGMKFRISSHNGRAGGPMYYIEKGLHCKALAIFFAVLCTFAALGMGNMTQSNSAAAALYECFGLDQMLTGLIMTVAVGLIIAGGISRIAALTEKLIPLASVLYLITAGAVIITNISSLPSVFVNIVSEAFDLHAAAGGFMGYGMARALKYGISRGVFSNEAGLGSSPIVHSAADTDDCVKQGMWGVFQVFIDTIVLCTVMALCILVTGNINGSDGVRISISAFENVFGSAGKIIIALSIVIFAFATLISWCYYGEKSVEYLCKGRYVHAFRIVYTLFTFLGSILSIRLVWDISDTINGLMAIPNLIALLSLAKYISYDEISARNIQLKKYSRTCKTHKNSI